MSGIFGFVHRTGEPADPADLVRMGNSLAHRGPDGTGTWHAGPVGLGTCILRTTPESHREPLPALNASGTLVLAADARIDNREELIGALGLADRARDGLSDGELIVAAYEEWGEACPERLLGDFAFALWDARRRVLFCVRDPMGVRPFFYHASNRGFAFASEIKALHRLPWVPREINELRIADYLVPQFEDTAITFYKGVSRLPAAHRMAVTEAGARPDRYWALDPTREIRLRSDDEYAEAFRDHFIEAVRCRLRGDRPVSALLSGGLDSSAIVCAARHVLEGTGRPVRTISAIFPSLHEADPRIDERRYVDAVVGLGGIEPLFVEADRANPVPDLLWRDDEAIPAPNLYMDVALMEAARDSGARVLLSGWDGDSTVSHGLELLGELARTGRWWSLWREASALSGRLGSKSAATRKLMWEYGFRAMVPDSARRLWRSVRGRPVHPLLGAINPEFARRIGLHARIHAQSSHGRTPLRSARYEHARGLGSGLLVYGLEILDKTAATCLIEMRYPFCDRRLVEFCVALPARQKLAGGWSRAVLRRAMAPLFPRELGSRIRKGNLSANFKRRFIECERDRLDEVMATGHDLMGEYLDIDALKAAYGRYASQPLQHEQDALTVFLGVTLALWWRERQDAEMPAFAD